MDIKQLKALVTVSDVGSVTKAAELLHLVQPAVTRQIRILEDEVGSPLFERTRQGMILTRAGELLVRRARRVLYEIDEARAEISPGMPDVGGVITIGLLESAIDQLASPIVDSVAARYPGVSLQIVTGYSGHLRQWLDDRVVDMSLLYGSRNVLPFTATPLLREPLWAVTGPGEELRPEHPVPWSELWTKPLVLPGSGHGLRVLIDGARSVTGGEPRVLLETNSMQVQIMMATSGRAWTVLPRSAVAKAVAERRVSGAPLCTPEVTRSIVLGVPRDRELPPRVAVVAKEVVRATRGLVHTREWAGVELLSPGRPTSLGHIAASGVPGHETAQGANASARTVLRQPTSCPSAAHA